MNTRRLLSSTLLLLAATGSLVAADATSFEEAFAQGKASLNVRARSEDVAQTGLRDAHALTLRTRLGYTTAALQGWKLSLEAENLTAADGDAYSQAGLNPGGTGRAVVADPETTEVNQAFVAFTTGQTTATLGRQRLVLDNARFVGDVGWRQNMQTFDALVLTDKSLAKTTLTYAYLNRINRVFGSDHAQGRWDSDSHLLHAAYAVAPAATLTGYAYLLDFDGAAAANSTATYGASLVGTTALNADFKFAYRAELATQADYGASALNYRTTYANLEAGLVAKPGSLTLGYEVLGSDHAVGFKTPLATLHAFNGWADLFLATPAAGLRDTYLKATATLPAQLAFTAFYHDFQTDAGSAKLGTEWNAQLTRKFTKQISGLVKYAEFRRDAAATLPNVRKVWLQVEFVY
jgi:hypothetical protein